MKVAHKWVRVLRVAVPHTLRTLAGVDIQPVPELEAATGAPPTGWVGSRGNLTVVVVTGVGSGAASQSRRPEEAVDNIEVPEVAGAL